MLIGGYGSLNVITPELIEEIGNYDTNLVLNVFGVLPPVEGSLALNVKYFGRYFESFLESPKGTLDLELNYIISEIRGIYIELQTGYIEGSFNLQHRFSAQVNPFYSGSFYKNLKYRFEALGVTSGSGLLNFNLKLKGTHIERTSSGSIKLSFKLKSGHTGIREITGTFAANVNLLSKLLAAPELAGIVLMSYVLYNSHYIDSFKYTKENIIIMNVNQFAVAELDTYNEVVSIKGNLLVFKDTSIDIGTGVLETIIEFDLYDINTPFVGRMNNLYLIGSVNSADVSVNEYNCPQKGIRRQYEYRTALPRGIRDRNLRFKIKGRIEELQALLLGKYPSEETVRNVHNKT